MKTVIFDKVSFSPDSSSVWHFLSDSAHTNAGKPFFIPDFAEEFDAVLAPVVKLSKLGKSIGTKFAHRYYGQIAPAVNFRASSLLRDLLAGGYSTDMAYNFDRALIIGDFTEITGDNYISPHFSLKKNGVTIADFDFNDCVEKLNRAISLVSASNTMKTGDLIIPVLSQPTPVDIGDLLEVTTDGNPALLVAVK